MVPYTAFTHTQSSPGPWHLLDLVVLTFTPPHAKGITNFLNGVSWAAVIRERGGRDEGLGHPSGEQEEYCQEEEHFFSRSNLKRKPRQFNLQLHPHGYSLILSYTEGNRSSGRRDSPSHTASKWPAIRQNFNPGQSLIQSSPTRTEAERCGFKSQLFHLLTSDI